ncbi:MAG: hypothetical protein CR974_01635 [Gammaproteobacteria bacterium]|nr:MAG: hypothetical protein CR974_01635 [Gammaproteobacteria bacterium]
MSDSLPTYVNPWLLLRRHETINTTLPLSAMPHLLASQNRQTGEAKVSVSVVTREDGQTVLRGKASAELELECQRCLTPLVETFEADFELVIVKREHQLERLDEADDGIVVEEQLELAPLIEQELILALPMIAKHAHCQAQYQNSDSGEGESQQPFANLKNLLN